MSLIGTLNYVLCPCCKQYYEKYMFNEHMQLHTHKINLSMMMNS